MKLESLNNSKYSLTPEKMGQLVGGEQCCEPSGPGDYGNQKNCSCDAVIHFDENEIHTDANGNRIYTGLVPFQGSNDSKFQSLYISQYGGLCK